MKIVGIEVKTGTYEGANYSNAYLNYKKDFTEHSNFIGDCYGQIKVKSALLKEIANNKDLSVNDLIGKDVKNVYYNRYGQVIDLVIE